jgi:hypothetical protein
LLTSLIGRSPGLGILRLNIVSAHARVLKEKGNSLKETVPPNC